MKKRELHISPWLVLPLAALLVFGVLLASAGIAYARYRTDSQWECQFQVAASGTVVLGSVDADTGAFVELQNPWQQTEEGMTLHFAVGNGTSGQEFSPVDQAVSVRLLGSPQVWNESEPASLKLMVGENVYTATVTKIREGSALYTSFGDGWIFRFLDEKGQELTWNLDGDAFAHLEMTLTAEMTETETSLLQLQVFTENR